MPQISSQMHEWQEAKTYWGHLEILTFSYHSTNKSKKWEWWLCETLMSFSSHSVEMLLHFSVLLALVACAKAKNNCSERGNTSSSAIVKTAFPVTAFPSLTMFLDHEATSSVFMLLEETESDLRTFPRLCFKKNFFLPYLQFMLKIYFIFGAVLFDQVEFEKTPSPISRGRLAYLECINRVLVE